MHQSFHYNGYLKTRNMTSHHATLPYILHTVLFQVSGCPRWVSRTPGPKDARLALVPTSRLHETKNVKGSQHWLPFILNLYTFAEQPQVHPYTKSAARCKASGILDTCRLLALRHSEHVRVQEVEQEQNVNVQDIFERCTFIRFNFHK